MVVGVYGLPRAGKTTFLTKVAQLCKFGRGYMGIPHYDTVYTNFECSGCQKLDFDQLGKYNFHDCLMLIDEIMLLADCRDYKDFSDNQKYFWSHHGHFNITILYCSQYWSDCDKKIRILTDHYYLMSKSSLLPITYIKPISRTMEPVNGKIDDGYHLAPPVQWRFVWRPHWYKYFDSYTTRPLPEPPPPSYWAFDSSDHYLPLIKRIKKRFIRKKSDTLSDTPECAVCPSENGDIITPPTPLQAHTSKFEQTFENKKTKLSAHG